MSHLTHHNQAIKVGLKSLKVKGLKGSSMGSWNSKAYT